MENLCDLNSEEAIGTKTSLDVTDTYEDYGNFGYVGVNLMPGDVGQSSMCDPELGLRQARPSFTLPQHAVGSRDLSICYNAASNINIESPGSERFPAGIYNKRTLCGERITLAGNSVIGMQPNFLARLSEPWHFLKFHSHKCIDKPTELLNFDFSHALDGYSVSLWNNDIIDIYKPSNVCTENALWMTKNVYDSFRDFFMQSKTAAREYFL